MKQVSIEFDEYLSEHGRITWLAKELGITKGAVWQWNKVPAERLGEVSRITGIPHAKLRPDLFKGGQEV